MPIFTKRWNDPIDLTDGHRLLVTRYRPRGVRKEAETWNAWQPDLGPSRELHAAAYGKHGQLAIDWNTYKARYLREMLKQRPAIADLAKRHSAGETITLLCSSACPREDRCHRSLLRDLIETEAAKLKPAI